MTTEDNIKYMIADDTPDSRAADEKLTALFSYFDPGLSDDGKFMSKLQSNLEAIEMVKRYNLERKAVNRKALVVATITGFVFGLLSSFFLPYISGAISGAVDNLSLETAFDAGARIIADNSSLISIALIAVTSVLISLNAYEFVLRTHSSLSRGSSR